VDRPPARLWEPRRPIALLLPPSPPPDPNSMIAISSSGETGSVVVQCAAYATAIAYGDYRRDHTRAWPILMLGLLLDIATQIICGATIPGLFQGFLLFPLYCFVATIAGILGRVYIEHLLRRYWKNNLKSEL